MICESILEQHEIRITKHRVDVLSFFIKSARAISHHELEAIYEGKIDRVSIYRILNSFSEAKILCKLVDSKGKTSYVFDKHSEDGQGHGHPHFKCNTCEEVTALPELPKSYMEQLSDLKIDHLNLLVEGICKKCDHNKV